MKIGIIAAMEEELSLLQKSLSNMATQNYGLFNYYTGGIDSTEVVLFRCGIGKVNAAVGTTLLIDKFKPDYLLNIGVAGGLPPHVNIGDVVISSEVRYYDADATAFNYEAGQIPRMPPAYRTNQLLSQLAHKAGKCCNNIAVHHGPVLSGDSFIHTQEQVSHIASTFPGAMAVEMEGAAVAQTTYLFEVPFILIRAISDKVCDESNQNIYKDCMAQSAENSTRIALGIINELQESAWTQ